MERVIGLPHKLAQRFRERTVEVAVRIDRGRLTEAGLESYRIKVWEADGSPEAGSD